MKAEANQTQEEEYLLREKQWVEVHRVEVEGQTREGGAVDVTGDTSG